MRHQYIEGFQAAFQPPSHDVHDVFAGSQKRFFMGALSANTVETGCTHRCPGNGGAARRLGPGFLTQWSPDPAAQREISPGSTPIRLSCTSYRLRYDRMRDIGDHIRELKALGYTAAESGDEWYQVTESQITELNDALRENDFLYYTIHVFCNDIHPDPAIKEENYRRRIRSIETAARLGLKFVVSHTGSKSLHAANYPYRDSWTRAVWDESVAAMKRLVNDTAGLPVDLAVGALNPTNIINPMAHVRLREDVGSDRIRFVSIPRTC